MREQRWESSHTLSFPQVLGLLDRLRAQGLHPVDPDKEGICYIEDWPVPAPSAIQQLDGWPLEDVTMIHVLDAWNGDFFLLVGRHHSTFQRYQAMDTYCSISHPWRLSGPLVTLHPLAMFWIGFRQTHSFIRLRLHTTEVIAPGDIHASRRPPIWLEERQAAFQEGIALLDLPVTASMHHDQVVLHNARREVPFFCSWPDAFGPCQFEFNSPDPFAFLVPASGLALTHHRPTADIRISLTGFSEDALNEFKAIAPETRRLCRCSMHTCLADLPDLSTIVGQGGRLYTMVAEFHTQSRFPHHPDAVVVIGLMGTGDRYQIEVRLNMMPFPADDVTRWLEALFLYPMTYAPLSPFP